MTQLKKLIKF